MVQLSVENLRRILLCILNHGPRGSPCMKRSRGVLVHDGASQGHHLWVEMISARRVADNGFASQSIGHFMGRWRASVERSRLR